MVEASGALDSSSMRVRPCKGMAALSLFFALGSVVAGVSCLSLLFPGGALATMWRINPRARAELGSLGVWAVVLMFTVSVACGLAAVGLWRRAAWGRRLALALLVVNLAGDVTSAVVRGDWRPLIGLPIAGALIGYLLRVRARAPFASGA